MYLTVVHAGTHRHWLHGAGGTGSCELPNMSDGTELGSAGAASTLNQGAISAPLIHCFMKILCSDLPMETGWRERFPPTPGSPSCPGREGNKQNCDAGILNVIRLLHARSA